MFSRLVRSGCAVLAVAAGLSGCAGDADPIYAQAVGVKCSLSARGWTGYGCANRPPGQEGVAQVSRYCYATLGAPNCFDRPDPDRKNQAQGSSGY